MKFWASLDRRDRRLLGLVLVLVLVASVLLALVHPRQEEDSYIPSSYSSTPHGARAAYLLLGRLGYRVQQSDAPLTTVADAADAHTVLVLAGPARQPSDQEAAAVSRVLARGGRVLTTGDLGASALPRANLDAQAPQALLRGICEAQPQGFSRIASGGPVVMHDVYTFWKLDHPLERPAYVCGNEGVVVSYAVGKGTVVWWASAAPLENREIASSGSLDLLLNSLSLGPDDRVVWDESLHSEPPAAWDAAHDRILLALLAQMALIALLLVLARSRRSGPLRPLPAEPRTSSLEFVRSLGGLYRSSGANDVPVTIAYDRFREALARRHGIGGAQAANPATLAATLAARFGLDAAALRHDLEAADGAGRLADLSPRQALALVRALGRHRDALEQRARSGDNHPVRHRGSLGIQYESQHALIGDQPQPELRRPA